MNDLEQIRELLSHCSTEQRREIFQQLRKEFPIHPIEAALNVQAEIILEAIHRSSDLTLRGVRGVIAEAAFEINVLNSLVGWKSIPIVGDLSYDYLLRDNKADVRVQVKMQRLKNHKPMMASEGYRSLPKDKFVVETQRTRGGIDKKTNKATRPYQFGEFDILSVSMHPSTNDWTQFMYTVGNWLIPRPNDKKLILIFQPVSMKPDEFWTNDFQTSVDWFRSGVTKTIS